jgi:hypothetical protein
LEQRCSYMSRRAFPNPYYLIAYGVRAFCSRSYLGWNESDLASKQLILAIASSLQSCSCKTALNIWVSLMMGRFYILWVYRQKHIAGRSIIRPAIFRSISTEASKLVKSVSNSQYSNLHTHTQFIYAGGTNPRGSYRRSANPILAMSKLDHRALNNNTKPNTVRGEIGFSRNIQCFYKSLLD